MPDGEMFLHETVDNEHVGKRFHSVVALTGEIFDRYGGLVYVAPCGVVVRAVAANIRHKTTDPAVVVVDVYARFAVSLLSGHGRWSQRSDAQCGQYPGSGARD